MVEALHCEHLTKRFGSRAAVDDLTLSVQEGEVFGFLGPNGAGKTTTIRMLLGLVRPDAGTSFVFGDPVPCPHRLSEIGAMVEEPAFYPWLSGRGNLRVLADSGARTRSGAVAETLATTGLREVATRKVKTYSQGMRQRLGLAAALLRDPRLLVLDEPANGLDPAGIRQVRDLLRSLGDRGVTVFLSSHLLGEVERICDRVGVIDRGRLVAAGTVTELGRSGETRVKVAVRPEDHEAALRLLGDHTVEVPGRGTFLVAGRSGREVNETLARGGVFAEALGLERSGLEEQFLALTGGSGEATRMLLRRAGTMRLLRAELRKLRRPLVMWTAVAVVGVIGLFDWGLQRNGAQQAGFSVGAGPVPTCSELSLPAGGECDRIREQQRRIFCAGEDVPLGAACDRAIARQEAEQRRAERQMLKERAVEFRGVKAVQGPVGGGILAGGMMASMVGATALLLLAGGHVGNEWSGRTIKQVLTQEGRRWRVLGAKVASLWVLGAGLLVIVWLLLAILGPTLAAAYHVPGPGVSTIEGLKMAVPPVARSLLVIGAFAAIGVLAAAITRNALGSFFLAFAVVVVSLILAGFKSVGRYTLTYWVAGWMGFHGTGVTAGPTYLWRDRFDPLPDPTFLIGLIGLLVVLAVSLGLALLRVNRSDIIG